MKQFKTAQQIYDLHMEAFKRQEFTAMPLGGDEQQFPTKEHVKQALLNGEIIPALFRHSLEHSFSISQQIYLWALLQFSNKQEAKFKKTFINALNNLGIK